LYEVFLRFKKRKMNKFCSSFFCEKFAVIDSQRTQILSLFSNKSMNGLSTKAEKQIFYKTALLPCGQLYQGFTLIELLVAIVIVGVLSTVALPSFLTQVSKARGSEAKSNLGSINRAQQSYRFDNGSFAPDIDTLNTSGMQVSGNHYNYSMVGSINVATTQATPRSNDLKAYAAGLAQGSDYSYAQVICESLQSVGVSGSSNNTATVSVSAGPPANANCAVGNRIQ
jgi:type IV pilus assembly protein PilA